MEVFSIRFFICNLIIAIVTGILLAVKKCCIAFCRAVCSTAFGLSCLDFCQYRFYPSALWEFGRYLYGLKL